MVKILHEGVRNNLTYDSFRTLEFLNYFLYKESMCISTEEAAQHGQQCFPRCLAKNRNIHTRLPLFNEKKGPKKTFALLFFNRKIHQFLQVLFSSLFFIFCPSILSMQGKGQLEVWEPGRMRITNIKIQTDSLSMWSKYPNSIREKN